MTDYEKNGFLKRVVRLFTEDWLRKVIALFVTLALYSIISGNTGQEQTFTRIPVELEIPETLVNMDPAPPYLAKVIVRGNSAQLKYLSANDLKIRMQVRKENFSAHTPYVMRLSPDDVKTPFGTSVIAIEPQTITLNLEPLVSKKVPVAAQFSGLNEMNHDYLISKITFTPSEVTVSGAESLLRDVDKIDTLSIPLNASATESFDYTASLSCRSGLRVMPEAVNCRVEIVKGNESRELEGVPLTLLVPPGLESKFNVELISASNVKVTLYGPRGKIAMLDEKSLNIFADLSELNRAGTYTVNVICQTPEDREIAVKNIYPDKVQVKLTLKNTEGK